MVLRSIPASSVCPCLFACLFVLHNPPHHIFFMETVELTVDGNLSMILEQYLDYRNSSSWMKQQQLLLQRLPSSSSVLPWLLLRRLTLILRLLRQLPPRSVASPMMLNIPSHLGRELERYDLCFRNGPAVIHPSSYLFTMVIFCNNAIRR